LRERGEQGSGIKLTYAIHLRDALKANRVDSYYHQERFLALEKALASSPFNIELLRNIVDHLDYGLMPIENYAQDAQTGEPFIRVTNIMPSGDIDLSDVKYIPSATASQSSKRVKTDDIIMVQCGSTTGKVAIVPEQLDGSLYASFCFAIRAKSDTNQKYLFYALGCRLIQEQIQRTWNVVSVRPNTSKPDVEALSIPLPRLTVQREMVREMEAARESRRRKLEQADALLSGLDTFLLDHLGLTVPDSDNRLTYAFLLSEIQGSKQIGADYFHPERINAIRAVQTAMNVKQATRLEDIADFQREFATKYEPEQYLGLAGVQSQTGELAETSDEPGKGQASIFKENDVLFARLRPYLNKVWRAERNGVCSTEFHVIRIKEGVSDLLPDYLAAVLRSSVVVAQTKHMMTGNTHPRLANEDVVDLLIPIPEEHIQREIVDELRRRRMEARRLREEAAREWEAAKACFEARLLGGKGTQ